MLPSHTMALETLTGTLLAYKQLEPGTFQHVDQITTERRTNHQLREHLFYTADGELYTVQQKEHVWAITRRPQNLFLQNIDEACRQLTSRENYFPDAAAATHSLHHPNTVVVDLKGLKLAKTNHSYSHFTVDPKHTKNLNSQQRKAAQRIYGPDQTNFEQNMDMFAHAGITLRVHTLTPEYVQHTLRDNHKPFLERVSWLSFFSDGSDFYAHDRDVNFHSSLRGVHRVPASLIVPEVPRESKAGDLENILAALQKGVAFNLNDDVMYVPVRRDTIERAK